MAEMARLQTRSPAPYEVILISSDESDEDVEETRRPQTLHWREVVERLLQLVKNREVTGKDGELEGSLQEMHIPTSIKLKRALRCACTNLAKLLAFCRGHPRRFRASEDLIALICEVLSLALPAAMQKRIGTVLVKEEVEGQRVATAQRVFSRMEPWIAQLLEDGGGRACAISATISRLEGFGTTCAQQIDNLRDSMAEHDREKERVAQEWLKVLKECQAKRKGLFTQREDCSPSESELQAFHDAMCMTPHVQKAFLEHDNARKALARRVREEELRRGFYVAVLNLACLITPLLAGHDEEGHHATDIQH